MYLDPDVSAAGSGLNFHTDPTPRLARKAPEARLYLARHEALRPQAAAECREPFPKTNPGVPEARLTRDSTPHPYGCCRSSHELISRLFVRQKRARNQKRASSVEVIRKQVHPVSLHTR
jgi:hypothetical protein